MIHSVLAITLLILGGATTANGLGGAQTTNNSGPMNDRVEALLARIQATASANAQKAQQAPVVPITAPITQLSSTTNPTPSNLPLHNRAQQTRVHEPTQSEQLDRALQQRQASALPAGIIPSFAMRADGRPFGFMQSRPATSNKIRELRGSIRIPGDNEDVPLFRIYFEGMSTTNNSDGFYSFPVEETDIEKFGIIICNKIQHTFSNKQHNTVDSFGILPDMNYKYYRFKKDNAGGGKWVQQEKDLRKKNLRIPSNAVVLPLNPAYFSHLETEWPGDFGSGVLKLPRIVLKADARAKLEDKANKSILYHLEVGRFYRNIENKSKDIGQDGKGEVVIATEA